LHLGHTFITLLISDSKIQRCKAPFRFAEQGLNVFKSGTAYRHIILLNCLIGIIYRYAVPLSSGNSFFLHILRYSVPFLKEPFFKVISFEIGVSKLPGTLGEIIRKNPAKSQRVIIRPTSPLTFINIHPAATVFLSAC